jgi:hypothetical protein
MCENLIQFDLKTECDNIPVLVQMPQGLEQVSFVNSTYGVLN